ncbi:hypothetical protein TNCV_2320481 [Trichonephila clavipes]|nr:hypothetical protein TNCV_2320481 [Trichonephila clavipes]
MVQQPTPELIHPGYQSCRGSLESLFQPTSAFTAGGTLNSNRATSLLVRMVAPDERWEAPDPPPGCSPSKSGWNLAKSYCHMYGAQGYGQRQEYI